MLLGVGAVIVLGIALLVRFLPDYGRCLEGHNEQRWEPEWVEMRQMYTDGKTTIHIPVYHPGHYYTVYVCNAYEFPEGDGKEQRKAKRLAGESVEKE